MHSSDFIFNFASGNLNTIKVMEKTYTSSSVATEQKTHKPVDYVAKTPSERLHPVEEFIDKLEEAVCARL